MVIALLLALQQTTAQPPRRVAPAASSVEIRVTDRSGSAIAGVAITAEGVALRDGTTDSRGVVVLRDLKAGLYRIRAEAEHFITLEREVTVRGVVPPIQLSLSRAPEPPPPPIEAAPLPQATIAPPPVLGSPGEPRVVSVMDLAERSLGGRDAVKVVPVACSGTSNVRLILVRDLLPLASHREESQTLYMVSGEAALTIGDTVQALLPGWVGVVPRTVPYSLQRKGRNPAVLLSVTAGQPC